ALAALAAACAGCGGGGERPPNIILITIESLRADHVGCYGYPLPTTPHLDELASESLRFDRAYSVTSWTLPSHASLFTGLPPTALQVTEPHHRLADSYETLAEILSEEGYYCIGFVSGPFLRTPHNLNQGFSHYDDTPSSVSTGNAHGDRTNPEMEEKISAFLRSLPPKPFFLFAYFWDVHYDFIAPPPFDTLFTDPGTEPFDTRGFERNGEIHPGMRAERLRYVISQYDGEIRCTDEMLGRIFGVLRETSLWDRTAILLTADHGEEFFEHGEKGHKNNLHRESLHVPLLVKLPGAAAPRADSRLATPTDLFPTALTLAGAAGRDPRDGLSLLGEPPESRDLFFELRHTYYGPSIAAGSMGTKTFDAHAATDGALKYMLFPRGGGERLFDLAGDPDETVDLSAARPADVAAWREKVGAWKEEAGRIASEHGAAGEAVLSSEEKRRLEALGYIQIVPR
ncbi:MAG: sulfatase, partial [Candidatus Eisenbacteria bacterium]